VTHSRQQRSLSFGAEAAAYERGRPSYPPEAIDWLLPPDASDVLDLGAGTGKLTRSLLETGARVIAVEPGEAMLAELVRVVPGAEAVHGAAEAIPLSAASVDAVTVGQAFHWFRHDEALPEIHRVLRPGGGLALVWNRRDQQSPLQRKVNELIDPFVPPNRPGGTSWTTKRLVASELFGPVEKRRFRFAEELQVEQLVERIASISFVAAAPTERRAALERDLRELVAAGGARIEFHYVTDVYVSRAE
jgi:SAM-dependent methyltransferase